VLEGLQTTVLVEEADCTICMDEMAASSVAMRLPWCAHTFHLKCIAQWFSSKDHCPVCRQGPRA
jgi:hypothetical protein